MKSWCDQMIVAIVNDDLALFQKLANHPFSHDATLEELKQAHTLIQHALSHFTQRRQELLKGMTALQQTKAYQSSFSSAPSLTRLDTKH